MPHVSDAAQQVFAFTFEQYAVLCIGFMKHVILSLFAASIAFGNFCPMRTMNVHAADTHVSSAHHAMAMEAAYSGSTALMLSSLPCDMDGQCFLNTYVADQRESSSDKQAVEPFASAGTIPAAACTDFSTGIPSIDTGPPGGPLPLLAQISTIVLRV